MGLRIRGENGHYEMTMKIAGRVTGGLHQRPEFNVALDAPELDLALFPTEVWPDGKLPAELASQVQPLFSTDFSVRNGWLMLMAAGLKWPSMWGSESGRVCRTYL